MKKTLILLLTLSIISCNSQRKRALVGETDYQKELNAFYKDASTSPLKKRDLKKFKGLDFFPVDSTYIVVASIKKTKNAPIFEMPTTKDRKSLYKEYGVLTFELGGKKHELTIYQNQEILQEEEYKDYLFLPFTDLTSGEQSYGGGRYMDVKLSDEQENGTFLLNFNNTYNPYCAYNEKFSCPLTPKKNHLNISIKAGVKDFKK